MAERCTEAGGTDVNGRPSPTGLDTGVTGGGPPACGCRPDGLGPNGIGQDGPGETVSDGAESSSRITVNGSPPDASDDREDRDGIDDAGAAGEAFRLRCTVPARGGSVETTGGVETTGCVETTGGVEATGGGETTGGVETAGGVETNGGAETTGGVDRSPITDR